MSTPVTDVTADSQALTRASSALGRAVLRPVSGQTRSETIASRITDAIVLGVFDPAQQLPSESALSEVFGVAPMTVREALTSLRERGLIVTRRGRRGGSFVSEGGVEDAFRSADRLDLRGVTELAEHQMAIVGRCAVLAAERASASELVALTAAIGEFGITDGPLAAAQSESRIFVHLARASQSTRLTREAIALQTEWIPCAARALNLPEAGSSHTLTGLRALETAVRTREAQAARSLVDDHFHAVCRVLTEHELRSLGSAGERHD
jgi:GntR family transcriptional repressor for pyruvate dehydrogenase complex